MTATQMSLPLARLTDPVTSRLAGKRVKAARAELVAEIRKALERLGPLTQVEIADAVVEKWTDTHTGYERWRHSTVISACASAQLFRYGHTTNDRGRLVLVWDLFPNPDFQDVRTVDVQSDVL